MAPPDEPAVDALGAVRGLVHSATQRLLGDTIALDDEQWRAASRLPSWSRGHVASHIARQAEGYLRLVSWARTGERQEMYASSEQRAADIEAGSPRAGLELQIDLDTTAGALDQAFDSLDSDGWDAMVEMRDGLQVPARLLPLGRLTELVLHHVDLDCGFEVDDIDQASAGWLLEWSALRLRPRTDFPVLELISDEGDDVHIGTGAATVVRGTGARLAGWLTGRCGPEAVSGANGVDLPPF